MSRAKPRFRIKVYDGDGGYDAEEFDSWVECAQAIYDRLKKGQRIDGIERFETFSVEDFITTKAEK